MIGLNLAMTGVILFVASTLLMTWIGEYPGIALGGILALAFLVGVALIPIGLIVAVWT